MTHEQQVKDSTSGRTGRLGYLGRAALEAAEAGLSVFPLHPGSKYPALHGQRDCDGKGVCAEGHLGWEQRATRDPRQITEWWNERPWNLGIATGPSGLVVIDLDDGRGKTAPEPWAGARNGREVLAQLAQAAGQPGPWATHQVSTPSGGQHLYFRAPEGDELRSSAGTLGWKIDVRAHGGFIVAAPSRREVGTYRAVNRASIAALPVWLAEALTPAERGPVTGPLPTVRPRGRAEAFLAAIVRGETATLAAAEPGTRHRARLKAARKLGQLVGGGALDGAEARAHLLSAAEAHIGVENTTRAEVERDLDDGLAYGAQMPREIDGARDRGAR